MVLYVLSQLFRLDALLDHLLLLEYLLRPALQVDEIVVYALLQV